MSHRMDIADHVSSTSDTDSDLKQTPDSPSKKKTKQSPSGFVTQKEHTSPLSNEEDEMESEQPQQQISDSSPFQYPHSIIQQWNLANASNPPYSSSSSLHPNSFISLEVHSDDDNDSSYSSQSAPVQTYDNTNSSATRQQSTTLPSTNPPFCGTIKVSSNFPYGEDDADSLQIELLDINILIKMSSIFSALDKSINLSSNPTSMQARQREIIINLYNNTNSPYNSELRQQCVDFMLNYQNDHPVTPTEYCTPSAPITLINAQDIIFADSEAVVIAESTQRGKYATAHLELHMDLENYKEALAQQLSQGTSAKIATELVNSHSKSFKFLLSFTVSSDQKLLTPSGHFNADQILAMTIAQSRAKGENLPANLTNNSTLHFAIQLLLDIESKLVCNSSTHAIDLQKTLKKVRTTYSILEHIYTKKLQNVSATCPYFNSQDIANIMLCASEILLFRFYRQQQALSEISHFYSLTVGEADDLFTYNDILKATELGVIKWMEEDEFSDGEMLPMPKDNSITNMVQQLRLMLDAKAGNLVGKLTVLNPAMMQNRQITKDSAKMTTKAITTSHQYQVIAISGIPLDLYNSKKSLNNTLLQSDGVFHQLQIPNRTHYSSILINQPHAKYYVVQSYDLRSQSFKDEKITIAIPLLSDVVTAYANHSIRVKYLLENMKEKITITVACSFITTDQLEHLKNHTEICALRPFSHVHLPQLSKMVLVYLQAKTRRPLTALAVVLPSKLKKNNNKEIKFQELGLIIVSKKLQTEELLELRTRLQIPLKLTSDATITIFDTIVLQATCQSKQFNYQPYPDRMKMGGLTKYYIIHNVTSNIDVHTIVSQFQENKYVGHALRFAYIFPEPSSLSLLVATKLDGHYSSQIEQLLSQLVLSTDVNQSFESAIELVQQLPGVTMNTILACHKNEISSVTLPEDSKQWMTTTKRNTIPTGNASTEAHQRSMSKNTIMNFYKPTSSNESSIKHNAHTPSTTKHKVNSYSTTQSPK